MYLSEPFEDTQSCFDRRRFWADLEEVNQGQCVRLVVPDSGSSSLVCLSHPLQACGAELAQNLQTQSVLLDQDGGISSSYSISRDNWATGVQGGSHMANEAVRQMITTALGPHLPPGEVAALVNDFERQKCQYDWTAADPEDGLVLRGRSPRVTIPLLPSVLQGVFNGAFSNGLHILVEEIGRVMRLRCDFAVVLCGGSYFNKGLRMRVAEVMARSRADAEDMGVRMKSLFLAEYDTNWCVIHVGLPILTRSVLALCLYHAL